MKIITTETTSTKKHITLRRSDILELLQLAGIEVPNHADFTILVPSGGDWSGMDLDLDENNIHVDWTE